MKPSDYLKKYYPSPTAENRVRIYTLNRSVAKSGMSAVIRAYVIHDNRLWFITEQRVRGCGLDRGHELAYNLFVMAYPDLRYQDCLEHHWI